MGEGSTTEDNILLLRNYDNNLSVYGSVLINDKDHLEN